MKRAIIIKSYGDTDISNAIVSGMVKELPSKEMDALRGELMYYKTKDAQNGVHVNRSRKTWQEKFNNLPLKYGYLDEQRTPGFVARGLLVGWAMAWLMIDKCYKRLSAWNRS